MLEVEEVPRHACSLAGRLRGDTAQQQPLDEVECNGAEGERLASGCHPQAAGPVDAATGSNTRASTAAREASPSIVLCLAVVDTRLAEGALNLLRRARLVTRCIENIAGAAAFTEALQQVLTLLRGNGG